MEKFKENGITFPIILETSDFLWFKVPAIRKSRSSFKPYLIKEMPFDEGIREVVVRNKLFSLPDYQYIYNVIGGHPGSYASMWYHIRYHKMTIQEALDLLMTETRMHLRSCLQQSSNISESFWTLSEFKKRDYLYNSTELSPVMNYLIQCNILFFTGEAVIPQKRLMTNAIRDILKLEGDDY